MTAVSILRVDFLEIETIHITCNGCKTEITLPINREVPLYLKCVGCNTLLWGNGTNMKAYQRVMNIVSGIQSWREFNQQVDHTELTLSFSLPQQQSESREKL